MSILKHLKFNIEDIASVVILEQTQNYRTRTKSGLVFGNSLLNPDVVFMDGNSEPTGVTYTFSVTYKDGKKEIIKADSGTDRCDLLLQKAMDGDIPNIPPVSRISILQRKMITYLFQRGRKTSSRKAYTKSARISLPGHMTFIMCGAMAVCRSI